MRGDAMLVLILRSAHSEDVQQIRTCVRASRRMRTRDWVRPHASRRRASHSSVRALHEPASAARLLSMRQERRWLAPLCFETHRSALSAGEAIALGTRCDAPQHEGDQDQPAAVRNVRLCFRPVIYRENCNRNVSAALSPKIPITAMWSNGTMRRAAPWFRLAAGFEDRRQSNNVSSPRKRGPIFQRRWLWIPACAGMTASGSGSTPDQS